MFSIRDVVVMKIHSFLAVSAVCMGCLAAIEARAQGFGVLAPSTTTTSTGTGATAVGATLDGNGPRLGEALTQRFQIGMVITALGGPCTGLYGTAPVPVDWPEQTVRIVEQDFSPAVAQVDFRMLEGTVKQMRVGVPLLPGGGEARAVITIEVRRNSLLPPTDTSIFALPNVPKLPKEMRPYTLPSPYIESTHTKIKNLSKQILTAHADADAWHKVEAIYDEVRERVDYVNGPLKGAVRSLDEGTGDCEELSSLFIAVCRASGVPARIVWVPDHCYPEFYLDDRDGKGHWFPCQAAGTREFGGITEHRPILQKGDNFSVPEKSRERQRYVSEYLTGTGGNPQVRFIRQLLQTVE